VYALRYTFRTYRGHQLIGRPDPGHLVPVEQSFDELLHRLVPLHEAHITQVESKEHERLVPIYVTVAEEVDQGEQTEAIEGAVTE